MWLGLAATLAGALLLTARRRTGLVLGVVGASLLAVASWALDDAADARQAMVATAGASLRVSPAEAAPVLADLEEGAHLSTTGQRYGDFVEAVLQDGRQGWLEEGAALPVIPPSG